MNSKNEKQYLIIGEIGQQIRISSTKDLIKKFESSLKDLGLTKNDIILISSKSLNNISYLLQSLNISINNKEKKNNSNYKEKYNDIFNSNKKEDYYLYSITNRYEIYKQQFENKYKSLIENNSFISSKELFGGGLGGDDIFLSGNKFTFNNNNLQEQKLISHIKEVYTSFKSISININSNLSLSHSLIDDNIGNFYKSLSVLHNYYKSQLQNIRISHETLKTCFEEVNSRILSIEKKINSFFTIKMSLNNSKDKELFEILINENRIKQIREKIKNQINYLKDKIKNKSQKFDEMVYDLDYNPNNFGNKIKRVVDEKKLEEIKNKIKTIETNFNEINKKYNRHKFENEIRQIQETSNINVNSSNFSFGVMNKSNNFNSQSIDNINNNYKGETELNALIKAVKNIKNNSEDILSTIKNFITESIIKEFFKFSSDIFITLESFDYYNKKFKSYINLLEKIDKDNFDLIFSLDEALKFKFYCNEYERRINFLKDLKKTVFKLKKSLEKENEIRQKFNEDLTEYFNEKLNDNKFGINNNIINFFDWDDIKGNFDVYGDKYYNNVEIDEDELNEEKDVKKNWKLSFMLADGEINSNDDVYLEYYSQQEMIYHLNNKILEYKSKINEYKKDIENKNDEFKELKFNFEQINNLFNELNKGKVDEKHKDIKEKKNDDKNDSNGIKKENKIFNPLYDEINEDEAFIINNNNSISSNEDIQKNSNKKDSTNDSGDKIFLSLEQTYLIKKSFFNYFTNLLSIKNEEYNKLLTMYNTLQMTIEDKYSQLLFLTSMNKINLISIEIGSTNLFIGNYTGIYTCLLLNRYFDKDNIFVSEYYLDVESLNDEIKNILNKEINFIIVGVVKEIKKDKKEEKRKENDKIQKKKHKKLVILDKILYFISYQKDLYSNEMIFKNYNVFN